MTDRSNINYVGRFAPSPTGPLHLGSAVAAIASFLDARANYGKWLLRIEDLDPPREVPGAVETIIEAIVALGMEWDKTITYQSERYAAYAEALQQLEREGLLYPCGCSRREIGPGPYPGTCRGGLPSGKTSRSLRFRVPSGVLSFCDATYGEQTERLSTSVGDFNLRRADGLYAYHLAVVVDDEHQGVTDIVRGVDLLSSTCRQIALQQCLGYSIPNYRHFPVVCDRAGNKLSKQQGAAGIDSKQPNAIWLRALKFLQQAPPFGLDDASLSEIIDWAVENWRPCQLQKPNENAAI